CGRAMKPAGQYAHEHDRARSTHAAAAVAGRPGRPPHAWLVGNAVPDRHRSGDLRVPDLQLLLPAIADVATVAADRTAAVAVFGAEHGHPADQRRHDLVGRFSLAARSPRDDVWRTWRHRADRHRLRGAAMLRLARGTIPREQRRACFAVLRDHRLPRAA